MYFINNNRLKSGNVFFSQGLRAVSEKVRNKGIVLVRKGDKTFQNGLSFADYKQKMAPQVVPV
jgi:hypothetical protein